MFVSDLNRNDIHLALPTISWMAKEAGVEFEGYLECERNGDLFARTGSTILGGHHHQQFNYLNTIFDVKYIIFGEVNVFMSSIYAFNAEVIVNTSSLLELYTVLGEKIGIKKIDKLLFCGNPYIYNELRQLEVGPYLFPEIYYSKAWAFNIENDEDPEISFISEHTNIGYLYLKECQVDKLLQKYPKANEIDKMLPDDDYGSVTVRIAERWKHKAKALAFADPAAILSQIPTLCRQERIAVYDEKKPIPKKDIIYNEYTEATTAIAQDVIRLAQELNNRVIIGRQTGDGDLFEWAKGGVCIQIMDPNRPAFPIVEAIPHVWYKNSGNLYEEEPDDSMLEKYANEGKILAALLIHSGEMAHNEAMLNFMELVSFTGVKLGIGVHAARYETCPQLWELINVPKKKGGMKGYIEPVLHAGGMGILAEVNCPPILLKEHIRTAMEKITKIAGKNACPKGYYAFADTDLETLQTIKPEIFQAAEENGLEYFVSSAKPGRNLILHHSHNMLAINQTSRTQCGGSPFVRITTVEDIYESLFNSPGWFIGTLDAPVISFNPYIWKHGSRFMEIVEFLLKDKRIVNVTPHTVARYARILKEKDFI